MIPTLASLRSKKNVFNLPNLLTIFRILLIPVLWLLLSFESRILELHWNWKLTPGKVSALVVAIAGLTDLLDGYIARKWKIESLLGKFLDPVADKMLLTVGLVMLMHLDRIQDWLVILLLSREFLITALRGVAAGQGIIIAAGQGGKWKTTLQLLAIGILMWYGPLYSLGLVILYAALIMSLVSGYSYLRDFFSELKRKKVIET